MPAPSGWETPLPGDSHHRGRGSRHGRPGQPYLTATADANGLCAMKLPAGAAGALPLYWGQKGFGMLAVPGQRSLSLPLYSTTLAENSWAEIAAAAAARIAARLWSPGDVKELTISGTAGLLTVTDLTIGAIILGFDHNAALEGSGRIHFQLARLGATPVALVDKRHGSFSDLAGAFTMNTTATSEGGWQGCHMRQEILGSDSADVLAPKEGDATGPAAGGAAGGDEALHQIHR